jgi:hypothetical protein
MHAVGIKQNNVELLLHANYTNPYTVLLFIMMSLLIRFIWHWRIKVVLRE